MAYTPKLTYKGRPLVRCGNDIYYGSMKDPFVVYLQVLSTKKENGVDVADKVHIVLLSTDESKSLPERIARQAGAGGQTAIIAGAHHVPHREMAEQVLGRVQTFLAQAD